MTNRVTATSFEYIEKTLHIAVDEGLRMMYAMTNTSLCCQVNDDFRLYSLKKCIEVSPIQEIHKIKGESLWSGDRFALDKFFLPDPKFMETGIFQANIIIGV